jgi:hypothetical protein
MRFFKVSFGDGFLRLWLKILAKMGYLFAEPICGSVFNTCMAFSVYS